MENGRFDLILLGMGEDGHTASLYPMTAALAETERLVVANYVEKLGTHRLTITVPVINQAAVVERPFHLLATSFFPEKA